MTEEQLALLKALHTIRDECGKHNDCYGCLLQKMNGGLSTCMLDGCVPCNWTLKPLPGEEQSEQWSPFDD